MCINVELCIDVLFCELFVLIFVYLMYIYIMSENFEYFEMVDGFLEEKEVLVNLLILIMMKEM